MDEKTYAQQLDLLRFQADEIAAARLQPDEEAQVEQDYHRASNAAKLLQLSQAALDLLGENETSLLTQAGGIGRTLQELQRVDAAAARSWPCTSRPSPRCASCRRSSPVTRTRWTLTPPGCRNWRSA